MLAMAKSAVVTSITAARASCQVTTAIRASASRIDPVQESRGHRRLSQSRISAPLMAMNRNNGRNTPTRCQQLAGQPAKHVADEGGRGKQRPRRHLACRSGIEKLRRGKPMPAVNQIGLQERQEHIAAAVQDRADLQEIQKQGRQAVLIFGPEPRRVTNRRRRGYSGHQQHDQERLDALFRLPVAAAYQAHNNSAAEEQRQGINVQRSRSHDQDCDHGQQACLQRRSASRHSAWAMTAITTGFMPYNSPANSGSPPNWTQAQASAVTMTAAGRMNAAAGGHQARPTGAEIADVHGHFGRVRAGNEIDCSEQVEELFARKPTAAPDDFILHDAHVRRRTAEHRHTQPQEKHRHLGQAGLLGSGGRFL